MTRVACIGSGYWGQHLIRNFQHLGALGAICDSDPSKLEALRSRYPDARFETSYAEILADKSLTAVVLATPAETHGHMAKEALLAGKDVLVEKPLCTTVSDAETVVALARERGRILMVGHLLWYHPAVLKLKELIDTGALGRIRYLYSNRLNLGRIRREENILWSFAPHDLSVILGLLGEMPDTVQAQGGNYLHERIADVTVSLLSFASGVKAHIFVSWLHPFKEQKLVVVGDRRMAVFDDVEKNYKLRLYSHWIHWQNQVPVPNRADPEVVPFTSVEPLEAECAHFLECVRTRQRPRTDGEEGLRVLTVLERCQQELRSPGLGMPGRAVAAAAYTAHESAFIDAGVEIGEGTRIWHVSHVLQGSKVGRNCRIGQNVVIGPNVTVGDNVKIQNNVSVYEGVTLEDDVFCGPSVVFTNVINPRSAVPRMVELRPTLVRQGASLGANCTVVCGVTIGRFAFIGAGAVVTKDVPDYALVIGNPARITGWMCECGVKLAVRGAAAQCGACGKTYTKDAAGLQPTTVTQISEALA